MEPIVLLGLIIVGYGGYVAGTDLWREAALRFPGRSANVRECVGSAVWRDHKPAVKKMAGMHV